MAGEIKKDFPPIVEANTTNKNINPEIANAIKVLGAIATLNFSSDLLPVSIIANIKTLGIDMIKEAGSGHPGIVLGAAPIIYTLYANIPIFTAIFVYLKQLLQLQKNKPLDKTNGLKRL